MRATSPLKSNANAPTEEVVFLLIEGFTHLAVSASIEVLRVANLISNLELYDWRLMAKGGKSQVSSDGLETYVHSDLSPQSRGTMLFVVSGADPQQRYSSELTNFLRSQQRHGVRVGALCSGSFFLAQAGLLTNTPCAIHWEYHPTFHEDYPHVKITSEVFAAQKQPLTASGGTAGAELMLHLVAKKHGPDLATAVADYLVLAKVRMEGDEQQMPYHIRYRTRNKILQQALEHMNTNIEEPLSTRDIAEYIGVSVRQIERTFHKHVGESPGKHYRKIRLKHVKALLASSDMSIIQIALATSFKSPSNFSKNYRQEYGTSPYHFHR